MIQQKDLELIVPPLRMCWQIPKDEFPNAALRWCKSDGKWHVEPAVNTTEDMESYPAPTVQEIWKDLASPNRHNVFDMILTFPPTCQEPGKACCQKVRKACWLELSEPLAYVVRYMKCDGLDEDHQPINEQDVQFIGDFMDDLCTTMLKAWFQFHGYELKDERVKK